ncbi:hypothetical protein ACFVYV_13040 [Streptomyces mirabilis]|uniref:hypothetical protein n=1 Tax=Streptomyces TaxID=1883 RepID=UPI000BB12946|nr:hypothetical protein [Streptomyces sp. Ag82_O1-15]
MTWRPFNWVFGFLLHLVAPFNTIHLLLIPALMVGLRPSTRGSACREVRWTGNASDAEDVIQETRLR